jgi:hypothetical protein
VFIAVFENDEMNKKSLEFLLGICILVSDLGFLLYAARYPSLFFTVSEDGMPTLTCVLSFFAIFGLIFISFFLLYFSSKGNQQEMRKDEDIP